MITDTISFHSTSPRTALPPSGPQHDQPDVAIAVLPLLRRVRDTLQLAMRFRDRCRVLESQSPSVRWGVPKLFFFNPELQRDLETVQQPAPGFPEPFAQEVARTDPTAAQAWHDLSVMLEDLLCVLPTSAEARNATRATTGLIEAMTELAPDHALTAKLADVLAVVDDEVVRVIDPENRCGYRLLVRGVATIEQLQTVLAQVTGDLRIAEAQLFRPSALLPHSKLIPGFRGSDHWLWGRDSLRTVPRDQGERLILIGEPTMNTRQQDTDVKPLVTPSIEVLEVIGSTQHMGQVMSPQLRAA